MRSVAAAAVGALALAGCHDATSVPDLNNVPYSTIANGLTPSTLQLLETGLLNGDRGSTYFRYVVFGETMARDIYNLDPAENRFVSNLLGRTISTTNFIGSGAWTGFYSNIQTALTINANLGAPLTDSISVQQAALTRGFTNTYRALELYRVFALHGSNGVAFPTGIGPSSTQGPILCQVPALARISAIYDSAYADLSAVPDTTRLPFALPSGFSSNGTFTTVAGLRQFNRALKGKTDVYRGILTGDAAAYTAAVTALNASFLNPSGDLTTGVYFTYSTAPNELPNPFAVNTIVLNPSVPDSIQQGDLRASKITTGPTLTSVDKTVSSMYYSPLASTLNQTGAVPLIRNAELVLLRAQAEIGLGQLAAATADINAVRTKEGGLAPYATFTDATSAINAVLYEKRYSLLLTGVQRLVDLRSYGRLGANGAMYFKQERPNDAFLSMLPIPQAEADARNGNIACTNS